MGFLPHVSCQVALTHDSYDYKIRGLGTAAGVCSHPQQDALTRRMAGIHVNLVPTGQDRDMTGGVKVKHGLQCCLVQMESNCGL